MARARKAGAYPPGAHLDESGTLHWPTSGISDQQKIAEAVAIADARRTGQPYTTKSGVNLGALQPAAEERTAATAAVARMAPHKEKTWPRARKKPSKPSKSRPKAKRRPAKA